MGAEIQVKGSPKINIHVTASNPEEGHAVEVRLIRGGKLLKTFSGEIPLILNHVDESFKPNSKTYYRLDVRDKKSRIIVSNPIFVHCSSSRSH
jgi:hypothetical protein